MKKVLCFVFFVSLILAMLAVPAFADGGAQIVIKSSVSDSVKVGDSFEVTVSVANSSNMGAGAVGFTITLPPDS